MKIMKTRPKKCDYFDSLKRTRSEMVKTSRSTNDSPSVSQKDEEEFKPFKRTSILAKNKDFEAKDPEAFDSEAFTPSQVGYLKLLEIKHELSVCKEDPNEDTYTLEALKILEYSEKAENSDETYKEEEEEEENSQISHPKSKKAYIETPKCYETLDYCFVQIASEFTTPEKGMSEVKERKIVASIPSHGPTDFLFPKLSCPNKEEFLFTHVKAFDIMQGEPPSEYSAFFGPNSVNKKNEEIRIAEKLLEKLFPRLKPPINYNRLGKLFKINRSTIRNMYLRWKTSGTFERKMPHCSEEDQNVTERLDKLFPKLKEPVNYNVLGMIFGINRSTIRNMYLRWKRDGTLKFIPAVNYAIPEEVKGYVTNLFEKNLPIRSVPGVHKEIKRQFPQHADKVKIGTLYDFMKRLKAAYASHQWSCKGKAGSGLNPRKRITLTVADYFWSKFSFVYVDETQFTLNSLESDPSNTFTLLCAMSMYGVQSWQVIKGGTRAEDFWWFAHNLIEFTKLRSMRKMAIFFPNEPLYYPAKYKNFYDKEFTCVYNAKETPEVNAIGMLFVELKNTVNQAKPKNEEELLMVIDRTLREFEPKKCCEFVMMTYKILLKNLTNPNINS